MKALAGNAVLFLLLGSVSYAGAFGADQSASARTTEPQGKEPTKKPNPSEKKKGADPNDDGGAQKGLGKKVKRCARGRLVKLDGEASKIEVETSEETVHLRITDKTIFHMGAERAGLADLKEGMRVTVYCVPDGPRDIAASIQIERPPPSPLHK